MSDMNIAAVLKSEIVRLARKEVRNETQALKKAAQHHRAEIASLKRRVLELEKQLVRQAKATCALSQESAPNANRREIRFSATGLAAQRKRFGLSANDVGLLVGASGQSVFNWESGKNRPRASQLPAIAELRKLGKKEVVSKLETLKATR